MAYQVHNTDKKINDKVLDFKMSHFSFEFIFEVCLISWDQMKLENEGKHFCFALTNAIFIHQILVQESNVWNLFLCKFTNENT